MTKMVRKIILTFILLIIFGNNTYASEEYEVYSDLIKQLQWDREWFAQCTVTNYVIRKMTDLEREDTKWSFKDHRFKKNFKELDNEIIMSFEEANKKPLELNGKLFKLPS